MAMVADLKTNLKFEEGFVKCHSTLDIELTPSGDLALVDGVNNTRQQILLWLATPQGERLDPQTGCPWYDYQHKKSTEGNLRELAGAMKFSLERFFPDLQIKDVQMIKIDSHTFYVEIKLGGNSVRFLFTAPDIIQLNQNVWAEFQDNGMPVTT
jgi:hypothetical protein